MVNKNKSKFKTFYDYLSDIGDVLPFVLFVIMPYLYDKVNGYSVIVCILISLVFMILTSISNFIIYWF